MTNSLDKIIESEYKKAFEILDKYIKYIKEEYRIDYKIPRLEIFEDEAPYSAWYLPTRNEICFFKESIEEYIDNELKFLGYKEINERAIDKLLKSLDYKKIISDKVDIEYLNGKYYYFSIVGMYTEFLENKIRFFKKYIKMINNLLKSLGYKEIKRKDIGYLNRGLNLILLYPFYINKRNIRKSIEEFDTLSTMFHEFWHSIDFSILDKLEKDLTIKDRDYLLTILKYLDNLEVRASAFEVIMYYLANGFHNDERGYMAAYANISMCRKYIEKIDILEKNKYMNINIYIIISYDLGRCYGNIIVAKYGPSLKENIYKVINDIIHLDKKRAIDEIKNYVYNPDKLLHDKNSNSVI